MYSMNNGILYEDGRAVFCAGVSYYPSFHKDKVPVPEDGDRLGEMKKDLTKISEVGFKLVRTAAIGEIKSENGKITSKTDFIDEMLTYAEEVNLATIVRLQGYTMNLSGYTDHYMVDSNGEEIDKSIWYNFIQNSLCHNGILKDNNDGTRHLAKHFMSYKSLVSYQTYNEPHYPSYKPFDYHPDTLAEYKKYLAENGIKSNTGLPPNKKPEDLAQASEWINWRIFSTKKLSEFLRITAEAAKSVCPYAESLTCLTADPIGNDNALRGVSFFDSARDLDVLGITHYIRCEGPAFFRADFDLNFAEAAAAYYGKHAWLIEYDARTDISERKFCQETYMAIGAGFKGILYYQWRGDCPVNNGPENNTYGIINYDGTPTKNFENMKKTVALLNLLSDYIVNAEKLKSGTAIFYSEHCYCYFDLLRDARHKTNEMVNRIKSLYTELKKSGFSAEIVNGDMLLPNNLNIKVLYVPFINHLSESEKAAVHKFSENGGKVFYTESIGFHEIERPQDTPLAPRNFEDTLEMSGITPFIKVENSSTLMTNVLRGSDYYVISLNNIGTYQSVRGASLIIADDITSAEYYTPNESLQLTVNKNKIELPEISDGGLIIIK